MFSKIGECVTGLLTASVCGAASIGGTARAVQATMAWITRLLAFACSLSLLAAPAITHAQANADSTAFGITYIEVAPAVRAKAAVLLNELRATSQKAGGNLRFDVLQRRERSNHFAIVETWKDKTAFEADLESTPRKAFREKLQPLLISGYDQRPHSVLSIGSAPTGNDFGKTAVFVVTHIDVTPATKDDAIVLLKELASLSRNDAGNLRFELLQQISRTNHSTLVETWTNFNALEEHEVAAHTNKLRNGLQPMSGSLFDQRLYSTLD